jgi:hypothetical protein
VKYKPDWKEAEARLSALWRGEELERPCIAVRAPTTEPVSRPELPAAPQRKWLDPEWILCDVEVALSGTWWGGEAIPSYLLMGGWTVSLAGQPRFSHKTIWFEPFEVSFDSPSPFRVREHDPWVRVHETLYTAVARHAGWDDYLVGRPCILPANDLLSMHMGTTEFLTALMDEPEWMEQAILQGARDLLEERMRLAGLVRDAHRLWYGNAGWMPFWAPERYTSTQSDVSCMLSPAMFERFVLPEIDVYGESFGALWYHLDGGDAQQHLPVLLSRPYMRVIQYVPTPAEPPNGPGHLALYRRIQNAGMIVHIQVAKEFVEPLIRALDPRRLLLDVDCASREEGAELLAASKRWMGARARAGGS